jgi:hypothetical protein
VRETIEFRVSEMQARQHLPDTVGTVLGGTVRRIVLSLHDPLVLEIGRIDCERKAIGRAFFTYWHISRKYGKAEMEAAELLFIRFRGAFEPAGEECGTKYDESPACAKCGAGAVQVGKLILNLGKAPRTKDLADTIAHEPVLSERFRRAIQGARFKGLELRPVQDSRRKATGSPWYQPVCIGSPVETVSPTTFGEDPFATGTADHYRCPQGHVAGLNLVSEVTVARDSWDGSDMVASRQLVGMRKGLLRPRPLLFVSQRLWEVMRRAELKGFDLEPVRLV